MPLMLHELQQDITIFSWILRLHIASRLAMYALSHFESQVKFKILITDV